MYRKYTGNERRSRQRRQLKDRRKKVRFEATITQRRSGAERRGFGGKFDAVQTLYGR